MKSNFLISCAISHILLGLLTANVAVGTPLEDEVKKMRSAQSKSVFDKVKQKAEEFRITFDVEWKWGNTCPASQIGYLREQLLALCKKIEQLEGTSTGEGESAARAEQERRAREEAERKAREAERQRQEQERLRREAAERAERERQLRLQAEQRAREEALKLEEQRKLVALKHEWISDGGLKSQSLVDNLTSIRFEVNDASITFLTAKRMITRAIIENLSETLRKLNESSQKSLPNNGNSTEIVEYRKTFSVPEALPINFELQKDIKNEMSKALQTSANQLPNAQQAMAAFFTAWAELYGNKRDNEDLSLEEKKNLFGRIDKCCSGCKDALNGTSIPNISTTVSVFLTTATEILKTETETLKKEMAEKRAEEEKRRAEEEKRKAEQAQRKAEEEKKKAEQARREKEEAEKRRQETESRVEEEKRRALQIQQKLDALKKQMNFSNLNPGTVITSDWENLREVLKEHPALSKVGINGAAFGQVTPNQMLNALNLIVSNTMLASLPLPSLIEGSLDNAYSYKTKSEFFDIEALNTIVNKQISEKRVKLASILKDVMMGKAHSAYDRVQEENEATAKALAPLREQINGILKENLIPTAFGMPKTVEWEGMFLLSQELQQLYNSGLDQINVYLTAEAKKLLPFVVCPDIARNNVIIANYLGSIKSVNILRDLYNKGTVEFEDYAKALTEKLPGEKDIETFITLAQEAIDIMWNKQDYDDWYGVAIKAKILKKDNSAPVYNVKNHMKYYVRHWEKWSELKNQAALLEINDGEQFIQKVEKVAETGGLTNSEIEEVYTEVSSQLLTFVSKGSFIKNLLKDRAELTDQMNSIESQLSESEQSIFQRLLAMNDLSEEAMKQETQKDKNYEKMKNFQDVLLKIIKDCKLENKQAVYGKKYFSYFPERSGSVARNKLDASALQKIAQVNAPKNASQASAQSAKFGQNKQDNVEIDQTLKGEYTNLMGGLSKEQIELFDVALKEKEKSITPYAASGSVTIAEMSEKIERIDMFSYCFPSLAKIVLVKRQLDEIEKSLSTIFVNKIEITDLTDQLDKFDRMVNSALDSFNSNFINVVYTQLLPHLRSSLSTENQLKLELVAYLNSAGKNSTYLDEALKNFQDENKQDENELNSFDLEDLKNDYITYVCSLLEQILKIQEYNWNTINYTDSSLKHRVIDLLKTLKTHGDKSSQPKIEIKEDNFDLVSTVLSIPKVDGCNENRKNILSKYMPELKKAIEQEKENKKRKEKNEKIITIAPQMKMAIPFVDVLDKLNFVVLRGGSITPDQVKADIASLTFEELQSLSNIIYNVANSALGKYNGTASSVLNSIAITKQKAESKVTDDDLVAIEFIRNNTKLDITVSTLPEEAVKKLNTYNNLKKRIAKREEVARATNALKIIVTNITNKATSINEVKVDESLIAAIQQDLESNKIISKNEVGQEDLGRLIVAIQQSLIMPSSSNIYSAFEALKTSLKLNSDVISPNVLKEYGDSTSISAILKTPGEYLPGLRINVKEGSNKKENLIKSIATLSQAAQTNTVGAVPPPPPPPPPPPAK